MSQQSTAVIVAAAVIFATTVSTSARQTVRADASRSAVLRLRPDTLATFFNNFAGLQVRLIRGIVDEIASPRVFTLKNERSARLPFQPNEVVIVVDRGSTVIHKGAPVVVTGIARTLLGAEMEPFRPLPSLNESERKVVAKFPIVMASSVQTPDGVQLMRPNP